jgi:hypothetical protein
MAHPSIEQLQVWLDDPVTKWLTASFASDIKKIEERLRTTRFAKLEDVTELQVTLDCAKRWIEEPANRLVSLIKTNQHQAEDETLG